MSCYEGFGNLADGRPFWTADFDGDGHDELLFYYPGDDNWWLGKCDSAGSIRWSLAGNTIGFGHGINDGRPFWVGDFNGDGKAEILFYYPGDDNWWLGTFTGTTLTWSLAGNTTGFGHGINDGRPFWVGRFERTDRDSILFYYPGDDNWWLGTFTGTTLGWSSAGNTAGFGHAINDGRPFWTGRFVRLDLDSVLFYYPGDDNWWVGTWSGGQITWSFAGNTAGFGHGINDGRPFWIGDFDGDGKADVLFYYPGDDNWWLGRFSGNTLAWSFAGNTAGFGHGINDGRPFWIGDFVFAGRDSVAFYYPGDDNWWIGTWSGEQLNWAFAGNTAGFGHGINDGRPFYVGRFGAGDARDDILFYYPGDGNWWLGSHQGFGGQFAWSFAGNSGAPFDASLDLNLILVGVESFTAADLTQVNDSLAIMRAIYRMVGIVIRNVAFFQITNAQAGGAVIIDNESEAKDLTSDWTVQNDAVDVFIVRQMNGADGWSAVNGSCNKDANGMTGSVSSLNGNAANSGNTFAHEVGHYLGLNHIADTGNFIGGNGGSDSWTGIFNWQGDVMKTHCFVHRC